MRRSRHSGSHGPRRHLAEEGLDFPNLPTGVCSSTPPATTSTGHRMSASSARTSGRMTNPSRARGTGSPRQPESATNMPAPCAFYSVIPLILPQS